MIGPEELKDLHEEHPGEMIGALIYHAATGRVLFMLEYQPDGRTAKVKTMMEGHRLAGFRHQAANMAATREAVVTGALCVEHLDQVEGRE